MTEFPIALGVRGAGAATALLSTRSARVANALGAAGAVAGSAIGMAPALRVLSGGGTWSFDRPWDVPYGRFSLAIDPLAAFFLVAIFAVAALTALSLWAWLPAASPRRAIGPAWFFFDVLVAAMALVTTAANGMLFLIAWEVMALASYFLVAFEHERLEVRRAGWTYLVATHLGTAFLLALFALLGRESGSMQFAAWRAAPEAAGVLLVLALVGFGSKAGLAPLHVWLPDAYQAAPGPVPAALSGAMSKVAIYGFLRTVSWVGPPPAWVAGLVIAAGIFSGALGTVLALASHDLRRALAYSSVENLGVVAIGIGLALLGLSTDRPSLAVAGLAGALLHVWSHSAAKALLFQGAASLGRSAGTFDLNEMGGLLRRMPRTGLVFLAGSVAIAALPPFSSFTSEFLLYLASFRALAAGPAPLVGLVAAIVGLAFIGGLALALFAKLSGLTLLGEPRSASAAAAVEGHAGLFAPPAVLALVCLALGLGAPFLLGATARPIAIATGLAAPAVDSALREVRSPLEYASLAGAGLVGLAGALALVRACLLAGKPVGSGLTWDCGYAAPTARMQYTGSSFSHPITTLYAQVVRTREDVQPPTGYFPSGAALATETPDVIRDSVFGTAFRLVQRGAGRLRWLQHGNTHLYVLYVVLALFSLLLWLVG